MLGGNPLGGENGIALGGDPWLGVPFDGNDGMRAGGMAEGLKPGGKPPGGGGKPGGRGGRPWPPSGGNPGGSGGMPGGIAPPWPGIGGGNEGMLFDPNPGGPLP